MVSPLPRLLLAGLIAGLTAAGPPPARADNDAAARREYRLGYADLQAGRFADALAHYRRSYDLAPRPRTLFNMALCEEKLGSEEAALDHYGQFVATAEPRDRGFLGQAQDHLSRLANKLVGRVTIVSQPPGAEVRVDGTDRSVGRTPLTLSLTPGDHYVHISADGAVPAERVFAVQPRGESTVSIELELSASIDLTVEPADATIQRVGETTTTRGSYHARVPAGIYQFVVHRAGYRTETVTVDANDGGVHEQRLQLRRGATTIATLVVHADADRLVVDGAPVAAAPGSRLSVAAGDHAVRVERDGYRPWSDNLYLSPGEKVDVDVTLHRDGRPAWLRWAGLGVGLTSFAAGGTLGVLAIRDVTSDASDRHDRGKTRALIADGLFVVGVAAVVTVWRWSRHQDSSAQVRHTPGAPE